MIPFDLFSLGDRVYFRTKTASSLCSSPSSSSLQMSPRQQGLEPQPSGAIPGSLRHHEQLHPTKLRGSLMDPFIRTCRISAKSQLAWKQQSIISTEAEQDPRKSKWDTRVSLASGGCFLAPSSSGLHSLTGGQGMMWQKQPQRVWDRFIP